MCGAWEIIIIIINNDEYIYSLYIESKGEIRYTLHVINPQKLQRSVSKYTAGQETLPIITNISQNISLTCWWPEKPNIH